MEETTYTSPALREKFRSLNQNRFLSLFHFDSGRIIFETLLGILRPMDIVSLTRATTFRTKPSEVQARKYLPWWREFFINLDWAETIGTTGTTGTTGTRATFIGNDIQRLQEALDRWEYLPTIRMKLLVIVNGPYKQSLLDALDTTFMWICEPDGIFDAGHFATQFQTAVVFQSRNYIDLDLHWSRHLLRPVRASVPFFNFHVPNHAQVWIDTFDGATRLIPILPNPLPVGLRRLGPAERYPLAFPWHSTFSACSPRPGRIDVSIESSITSAEIIIDTGFDSRNCYIRLAIADDGHIIIPNINQEIWDSRRFTIYWKF
jgi:hypothetical protein